MNSDELAPEDDDLEPDDENEAKGDTEPDAAEISHRLGWLINQVDLTPDQEAMLQNVCEEAQYFNALPIDVKVWFSKAEQEFGVHPLYVETVDKRMAEMMKRVQD